jgi:hypothetical protein
MGDRFSTGFEEAAKQVGASKDYGSPRKIAKGAQPEILLKDGKIWFNGRELVLGRHIDEWQKIIGKGSLCSPKNERPSWCKWDALGIEISARLNKPTKVTTLNVRFSRDADEGSYDLRARDSTGKPVDPIWLSNGVFPGYLEFDGFGIDKQSKFWEVRMSVDRRHGLRCGLRNCHQPLGAFGPDANVYMVLNSDDEYGELRELSVNADSNNN